MLKMTAIGNLTSDPQMRTNTSTGKEYAIMRIASDRRYRDKDGNKYTDFVSIKVYSPLAERCVEHLHKSDKIAANGDFETITTTQNGVTSTGFLVKANEVEFLSPKKRDGEQPDAVQAVNELSIDDPIEKIEEVLDKVVTQ